MAIIWRKIGRSSRSPSTDREHTIGKRRVYDIEHMKTILSDSTSKGKSQQQAGFLNKNDDPAKEFKKTYDVKKLALPQVEVSCGLLQEHPVLVHFSG